MSAVEDGGCASEKGGRRGTCPVHVTRPETPVHAPPVSGASPGEHSAVYFLDGKIYGFHPSQKGSR
jgi:hypothetical protein